MLQKTKVVQIDWIDAHSVDEWTYIDDDCFNQVATVTTIGFLTKETESYYVCSLNVDGDKVSCSMIIPKPFVKRIRSLNVS